MTTDGINHSGVGLITSRRLVHPDAAIVADVLRESLAGAYAHEQHGIAQIGTAISIDHPSVSNDAGAIAATTPIQVAVFTGYIPAGTQRIVSEVVFLSDFDSNMVALAQVRVTSAVNATPFASGFSGSTSETPTEGGSGVVGRARATWDVTDPPVDGGLVIVETYFALRDTAVSPGVVSARLLTVNTWTESTNDG